MSELKPCPYCGSEDAYNVYLPDPYSRDQYAWVNCKTCNASGGQFVQRVCPDDKSFSRNEMELESTKLWNTRPIEDALNKRIAELEMKIRHNALWQASEDAEERAHLEKLVPDLKKRIGELEKDNTEFRQLIRDWSIVLDQNDEFQLWQVESVRQAMLEINKEREE